MRTRILILAAVLALGLAATASASWPDGHAGRCVSKAANGPGVLLGTHKADCLAGSNGPDLVKGKAGDDVIAGNHGPDVLKGGPGDDRLWPGRGLDSIHCGAGFDTVHQRRPPMDVIAEDCEEVRT